MSIRKGVTDLFKRAALSSCRLKWLDEEINYHAVLCSIPDFEGMVLYGLLTDCHDVNNSKYLDGEENKYYLKATFRKLGGDIKPVELNWDVKKVVHLAHPFREDRVTFLALDKSVVNDIEKNGFQFMKLNEEKEKPKMGAGGTAKVGQQSKETPPTGLLMEKRKGVYRVFGRNSGVDIDDDDVFVDIEWVQDTLAGRKSPDETTKQA